MSHGKQEPPVERTSPSALTFSRLLGEGPLARVALRAALAQIASPAFIVSARGSVLETNPEGARRLARSRSKLRPVLLRALRSLDDAGAAGAALVTPLRGDETPIYHLVIFRPAASPAEDVDQAAQLWELTRRQREVLRYLVEGFSNKTIAVRLGCAERTVETHLTAIFAKSGFDGRSALLAAFARRNA